MSYIGQTLPADTFQGFVTDTFTGDGTANKTFTLSKTPFNESAILVTIDGVVQEATDDFTVSGTTLTLVGTAPNNSEVNAIHIGGALPIGQAASLDLNGASDQLILDADADTTISADTDDQIDFKIGGTDILNITNSSSDVVISSMSNDKDIIFKGQDGGSTITAFTLDMSAGGEAELRNGLTLADGNLTVASGHGINFAATGDGAGTDSSELFDDYEEGTWSPVFTDGTTDFTMTSTSNTGWYTKVGRNVTCGGYIQSSSKNSASGASVRIKGLPYAVQSVSGNQDYTAGTNGAYLGGIVDTNAQAFNPIGFYTEKNTSYLQLSQQNGGTGSSSLTPGQVADNFAIIVGITYKTA